MATNLIDLIKGYLTPEIVAKAASYVGESGQDTYKALSGLVPTTVAALGNMAATKTGAQQISQMLDSGKYDGSMLANLGNLFSGGVAAQNAIGAGKGFARVAVRQQSRRRDRSHRAVFGHPRRIRVLADGTRRADHHARPRQTAGGRRGRNVGRDQSPDGPAKLPDRSPAERNGLAARLVRRHRWRLRHRVHHRVREPRDPRGDQIGRAHV